MDARSRQRFLVPVKPKLFEAGVGSEHRHSEASIFWSAVIQFDCGQVSDLVFSLVNSSGCTADNQLGLNCKCLKATATQAKGTQGNSEHSSWACTRTVAREVDHTAPSSIAKTQFCPIEWFVGRCRSGYSICSGVLTGHLTLYEAKEQLEFGWLMGARHCLSKECPSSYTELVIGRHLDWVSRSYVACTQAALLSRFHYLLVFYSFAQIHEASSIAFFLFLVSAFEVRQVRSSLGSMCQPELTSRSELEFAFRFAESIFEPLEAYVVAELVPTSVDLCHTFARIRFFRFG